MTDIVERLENPPFGTETSERNLMASAAAEIERLRAILLNVALAMGVNTDDPEFRGFMGYGPKQR
jgi:hypothetical protein